MLLFRAAPALQRSTAACNQQARPVAALNAFMN
jgi:hypothetical protein